ncbi:MAG: hypothetical protein EPN36_01950 [Rhodanobacteraceae bacterium]|nr:MAG: hypothetical protein EPN36_01950 [Rhodanobacteraceae bacterium]
MNTIRNAILLAACILPAAAWAQTTSPPLNLQLPPSDMPATASTTASHPASRPARDKYGNPVSPPGVYYGDHSSGMAPTGERVAAQHCDDSTYNKPQMHGSASMGVMGGNHVSGNYEAATINMTKNLGDCENPSGGIGLSIHVSQSRFNGRHW